MLYLNKTVQFIQKNDGLFIIHIFFVYNTRPSLMVWPWPHHFFCWAYYQPHHFLGPFVFVFGVFFLLCYHFTAQSQRNHNFIDAIIRNVCLIAWPVSSIGLPEVWKQLQTNQTMQSLNWYMFETKDLGFCHVCKVAYRDGKLRSAYILNGFSNWKDVSVSSWL